MSIEEDFERATGAFCVGQLDRGQQGVVIRCCEQLLDERREIRALLAELPADFGRVRDVLNRLAKMVDQ